MAQICVEIIAPEDNRGGYEKGISKEVRAEDFPVLKKNVHPPRCILNRINVLKLHLFIYHSESVEYRGKEKVILKNYQIKKKTVRLAAKQNSLMTKFLMTTIEDRRQ